jgi:group I intron endonuclease
MNFIYITTNKINGKQYIGSHEGKETDNYLGSGKLIKQAIKKYGAENFQRKIIKECDITQNLILEEKYIKKYNTLFPNGYNLNKCGGHNIFNEELKNKLSYIKTGSIQSEETRKKRSLSLKGKKRKPQSEETKRKISESKKGLTPWNKGIPWKEETKQKMRKLHKKFSEETKKNLSIQRKGRVKSDKHCKNISISKMGINNPMYGKIPWNKGMKKEKDLNAIK